MNYKFSKKAILCICLYLLTLGSFDIFYRPSNSFSAEGLVIENTNPVLDFLSSKLAYLPKLTKECPPFFNDIANFTNVSNDSCCIFFNGLLWLVLFIGTAIYYGSNKKRFLIFSLSINILSYIINLFYLIPVVVTGRGFEKYLYNSLPFNILLLFLSISISLIFYLIIRQLKEEIPLKEDGDGYIVETSINRRLKGWLLELLLIALFGNSISNYLLPIIYRIDKFLNYESEFKDLVLVSVFYSSIVFFYYLIYESLFQTTPAKILMGSKVLTTDGGFVATGAKFE